MGVQAHSARRTLPTLKSPSDVEMGTKCVPCGQRTFDDKFSILITAFHFWSVTCLATLGRSVWHWRPVNQEVGVARALGPGPMAKANVSWPSL